MKNLILKSTLVLSLILILPSCASIVKSPEQMKVENNEHLVDATNAYISGMDVVKANKDKCQPEKDHWSWEKIVLNQLSYVVQLDGMNDKSKNRTFAQLLCSEGVREKEHILKVVQDTSNLSSSEESKEGITKIGFVPIKVSAYLANGDLIPTKENKTHLSKNSVNTFLEFETVPSTPFYILVEVDPSYDPKKPLKLSTMSGSFSPGKEQHFEFYPYSSGIVTANWVGSDSQLFKESKVLEKPMDPLNKVKTKKSSI